MIKYVLDKEVFECIILKRINRFTVEVLLNNNVVKTHITNTGRLEELLVRGKKGYCFKINAPKLKYRLFAIADHNYGALIDTRLQEQVFEHLVSTNNIKWLNNCVLIQRNPRINNVVIDYKFKCEIHEVYVEVKSAVLRINKVYAGYPDCPTLRGREQIKKLIEIVEEGGKTYIVFIAGLPNIKGFTPYDEGDPLVAKLIREAHEKGVVLKAINMYYNPREKEIIIKDPDLPIILRK